MMEDYDASMMEERAAEVARAEGWSEGFAQGEAERLDLVRVNSELRLQVSRLNQFLSGEPGNACAPTVVRSSWHNIYPDRTGNERTSRRAADRHASPDRVGLVRLDLFSDNTVQSVVLDLATGAEVGS